MKKLIAIVLFAAASAVTTSAYGLFGWFGGNCCGGCYSYSYCCPTNSCSSCC